MTSVADLTSWTHDELRCRLVLEQQENERLRNLAECECGDMFTEHDKGQCVNCISTVTAPYSLRVAELEAEVSAWRSRFTEYRYRPQDDCVALK